MVLSNGDIPHDTPDRGSDPICESWAVVIVLRKVMGRIAQALDANVWTFLRTSRITSSLYLLIVSPMAPKLSFMHES